LQDASLAYALGARGLDVVLLQHVKHGGAGRKSNGMTIEWTDLSFQEATQGNAALLVFPVSVLLAFLVLAALYESWVLPLAVILIVPMCMLSALAGVKLYGSDNNTFVQSGSSC
jgi:multidrug efflux pump subunit AcrB